MRTTSPFSTVCGGQARSMRYAVAPTSVGAAASSQVRCGALGKHWCACTFANCANDPQLVSYPHILNEELNIGSLPAFTNGSSLSHQPQWITTRSPTLTLVTPLPTA